MFQKFDPVKTGKTNIFGSSFRHLATKRSKPLGVALLINC
ncbi:hypothetical protein ANCCEY_06162 [Ancylostoma ceylanicum]|uniref:Uncharacterized protein n=1 Tax=Ancylostoma ceylanicum TaxID=53326 RepID=A0A0D6M492_9BILA|nr:hypothetical protein ANCCEY_06162 [Ancylostoma ceylanicum]